jgi:hypothetical protein
MNFPTLHVGVGNVERDAQIAAALSTDTVGGVANRLGVTRASVRAALGRHRSMREFDLFLLSGDTPPQRIRVCHVVAAVPFTSVALAAWRAYRGTLKRLEVPGWRLTDGSQCCSVADLQQATTLPAATLKHARRRANAWAWRHDPMIKPMAVYFHAEHEGALWRGLVINHAGDVKARTGSLYPTQEQATERARKMWQSLQRQLQAVTP